MPRIIRLIRVRKIDLDNLHFCRDSKARYKKHLTFGMVIATAAGMIGIAWDVEHLAHVASIANMVTAIFWIWE